MSGATDRPTEKRTIAMHFYSIYGSEQLCCSINFLTKKIDRYVIESVPKSFLKPHICGA